MPGGMGRPCRCQKKVASPKNGVNVAAAFRQYLERRLSLKSSKQTFPAGLGDRVERPRKEKEAMVFGSTVLEIAIGVIFVYLLMSLLCSALAEFIESLFKFRARDLEKGITKLLGNPEMAQAFFDQPMVKTMFQGRRPSYVPARTFSLALWNMATAAAEGTPSTIAGVTKDMGFLRSAITA